jgi:L-fuconolactonase
LSFDALVQPRHLAPLLAFAARHPRLPIVIDHAAKPHIAAGRLDPWRDELRRLSELPNVCCKLSGLVTEARSGWQAADLAPFAAHVLDCFGPQRVMWGSDWPVVNLAGDYAAWLGTARSLVSALPSRDQRQVFHDTAVRFYRLDAAAT